ESDPNGAARRGDLGAGAHAVGARRQSLRAQPEPQGRAALGQARSLRRSGRSRTHRARARSVVGSQSSRRRARPDRDGGALGALVRAARPRRGGPRRGGAGPHARRAGPRAQESAMKVVLFCGGLGTRLREHSETIPKPLVNVGFRPILWHLMRYYAHFGHKDFILCLGYRGDLIREYFLNYREELTNDFTLDGGTGAVTLHRRDISDW